MKYSYRLAVDVHDVDASGEARCSALMRYMQTAAQSQLTENGMSYDELKGRKRAFILSKITMEFTESIRAYAPLSAISYPVESRGYTFYRCYALEREGRTIGRAVSAWALIDTDTHSLVRVNDFELGISPEERGGMALERFSVPATLKEVGYYRVRYSDLDQNGHMNNTRYPDMYADFLPMGGMRISRISISWMAEAPAGENLRVLSGCTDGVYYIRTVREDGKINTEAQIMLSPIT